MNDQLQAGVARRDALSWVWEAIRLREAGATAPEIAARLGVNPTGVTEPLAGLGLSVAQPHAGHDKAARPTLIPIIEWTPEIIADLRDFSFEQFRRKYRISERALRAKRAELGIKRKPPRTIPEVRFTPQMLSLLGKRSDERLARSFHVNKKVIRRMRLKAGIPSYRSTQSPWTEEYLHLLGKIPDPQLAARMGINQASVWNRRWRRGIKPCGKFFKWTERKLALLGTMPDAELAARLGLARSAVTRKRERRHIRAFGSHWIAWTTERIALLETLSNDEVARRLGITPAAVGVARRRYCPQAGRTTAGAPAMACAASLEANEHPSASVL